MAQLFAHGCLCMVVHGTGVCSWLFVHGCLFTVVCSWLQVMAQSQQVAGKAAVGGPFQLTDYDGKPFSDK